MAEIKICVSCKKTVSERDIKAGSVIQQDGKVFCQDCSKTLGLKKGSYDESAFILQSVLNEVKNINRALTYDKGSWLNIVAAVVQCFVFGALIFAYLGRKEGVEAHLLLAIVFQLMALTLFVIKK